MKEFYVPMCLDTDAYQLGHFLQIPPGMEHFQCSQAVFRKPLHYGGDIGSDYRVISAGLMPFILLELLGNRLTKDDLEQTDWFLGDFHAKASEPFHAPYPWPKEMFQKVVEKYDGRYPVCVMALKDGQAHYVGEPHLQLWTDEPGMGECVGFLEAMLLPYLWASSAVATRGRMRKQWFLEFYRKCHPNMSEAEFLLDAKFHDFGRRGGAAAQITGIAHLLNWLGTDTMSAAYAATKYLNKGKKFGANSIIAYAHRTVTPWNRESQAVTLAVKRFKGGIFAFVADSYDYTRCLQMLGGNASAIQAAGGWLVGRPDSGDPVEAVIDGVKAFAKAFGTHERDGLKIITGASIIQGDGVSDRKIFRDILPALVREGFSPLCVSFGMGEYNHRAVRSDLEHALKTCCVGQFNYGTDPEVDMDAFKQFGFDTALDDVAAALMYHNVMKKAESRFKMSLPGPVSMHLNAPDWLKRVRPISVEQLKAGDVGDYAVLYDGRSKPLPVEDDTFGEMRARILTSWDELPPSVPDTFDPEIRRMQAEYIEAMLKA